jgi:hypothetical protein
MVIDRWIVYNSVVEIINVSFMFDTPLKNSYNHINKLINMTKILGYKME